MQPEGRTRAAHVTGWGRYAPSQVLTNADLERMVDTSDEWIRQRTGIRERHIAAEGETTSDMGLKAARAALEAAAALADALVRYEAKGNLAGATRATAALQELVG
jgi:3-oxoacyl-[acyl-carrier-protein] synthase III